MTPTKLSESDKLEILRLYQQSDENTITLSKRYGVSSSTVRRILQNALSEEEYEALVQQKQKRLPHAAGGPSQSLSDSVEENDPIEGPGDAIEVKSTPSLSSKLTRRRSSATPPEPVTEAPPALQLSSNSELRSFPQEGPVKRVETSYADRDRNEFEDDLEDEELLEGEDFGDFDDEEEDEDDLDDFDGDEGEDDDSIFEDGFDRRLSLSIQLRSKTQVQVLPLSEASLPKTCYLVVDRAAELITRPLKAFGELGQIPDAEIREKTLPVFDNHRVARRFSTRNQRVFKVPDGRLLQKAAPYLQAKGITRLLIDGQVYSL